MRVPDYQRGYAWDVRNWDDFLDDLDLLEPGKQHYTGTLVLHSPNGGRQRRDEEGRNYEIFHIVDGQQRLTTIVLLLDALRREVARVGKLKLAEGIKKNYISVPDFDYGRPLFKLQLNRDTHDYFVNNWVCPVSTDCLPLSHSTSSHSSFLVLSGAEMPQGGMPPAGIVEALDVLEDRTSGVLAARP